MAAKSLVCIASAFAVLAVGCTGAQDVPATSPSPIPSLSPLQEARDVMGSFNLTLPNDAQQVQVAKPPLDDFRTKAVVSFIAPREQVMNQTCKDIQSKGFDLRPILVYPADDMLKFAGATINDADYGSCDHYEGKRKIIVLIPKVEGDVTYIVLYHMAVR